MSALNNKTARVVAVSKALPAYVDIRGKRVLTSIVRTREDKPLNLVADGAEGNQTAVHTEHLLASRVEDYDFWSDKLGLARDVWPPTHWGENIIFKDLPDDAMHIGTVFRIGSSAVLQVTSPRNPCFKLSWRIDQPDALLDDILASGRGGFYLRVLVPGQIFDGDEVSWESPEPAAPSIHDVARMMSSSGANASPESIREMLTAQALGVQCAGMLRQRLTDRLDRQQTEAHRWTGWREFKVDRIGEESSDVRSFELSALDGKPIAGFRAGQHVKVRLLGRDGKPMIRAWSLSDFAEEQTRYRISIKRSARKAASAHMHDEVTVGSRLELSAPSGSFHLDRSSNHPTVLISAGIGVTPMLSMLKAYRLIGPEAPPLQWIRIARNSREDAHRAEAQALLEGQSNLLRHVRYTNPLESDRIGIDYDSAGRMTLDNLRELIAVYRYPIFGREVELPGAASEFYICGPEQFESDMREMLLALAANPRSIRSETFGSESSTGSESARIYFSRSGIDVEYTPGESILEAAEAAGISAEHDCRSGTCHQCAVRVVSGSIAYVRAPVVAPSDGLALICCSRPASASLVLDL